MMNIETFGLMLFAVSILTNLTTQAAKVVLESMNIKWNGTLLAGVVAVIIGTFFCYGYAMFSTAEITPTLISFFIFFVYLGWLCATVGYDTVIKAIKPIFTGWSDGADKN